MNKTKDNKKFELLQNEIVFVRMRNGKTFSAKLVDQDGEFLIFKTSTGRIMVDRVEDVVEMAVLGGGRNE